MMIKKLESSDFWNTDIQYITGDKTIMKVYVQTVDKYEDEEVIGVFTSIEKLNEFKDRFPMDNRGYNKPKEFILDNIPDKPENKSIFSVSYDKRDKRYYSWKTHGLSSVIHINKVHRGIFGYSVFLWASDEKEANELGKKRFFEEEDFSE